MKLKIYFFFRIMLCSVVFQMSFSQAMVQAAGSETHSAGIYDDEPKFKLSESAKKFVPEDYGVLMGVAGDLTGDGNSDIAVVLSHESEKTETDDVDSIPSRKLLILLSDGEGGYLEVISNENAILCKWCGGALGDPLWEINIKDDGVLNIHHYAGSASRWGYNHNYKFINDDFYLISESYTSYYTVSWCDELENYENFVENKYDYITGEFLEYEITDCEVMKNVKGNKKPDEMVKLSVFKFHND